MDVVLCGDAALIAKSAVLNSAAAGFSCTNGELRLEGGDTPYVGRVEVCVDNKFAAVCDDGTWGTQEAQVVCRQLNLTDGGRYRSQAR